MKSYEEHLNYVIGFSLTLVVVVGQKLDRCVGFIISRMPRRGMYDEQMRKIKDAFNSCFIATCKSLFTTDYKPGPVVY